ncbi:dihydroorotase [Deinococcus sp.]|uniref:dihydroorotase n=1 Tax=Deinococcus sp. TaxID=47478 RepID=UPI003CC67AC8
MSLDLVIHGQLVTPSEVFDGFLGIQDGKIAAISRGELDGPLLVGPLLDVSGQLVFPGGIDVHVHVSSSELHPEGWTRLTQCAAAGGITSVIDMPYDAPQPTVNAELFAAKVQRLRAEALIDAGLYGTIRKRGGVPDIAGMAAAGASAFKFSTYETDPQRFPRIPGDELLPALRKLGRLGLPAVFHAEDGEIIDALIEQLRPRGQESPRLHAQSRPPVSEMVAVAGLLELARAVTAAGFPVKLHIAHLTVPPGFHLLEHYRSLGIDVTAETCIHYLTLNEDDLEQQGAPLKCNPPLRPAAMQEALWAEVLAGRVSCVTTDHAPWPPQLKDKANIFDNKSGMPGLETMLPLLYSEGVVRRGLPLTEFARLTASGPAERFGLAHRKGSLRVGLDADLCILDPAATHTVRAAESYSIAQHSPYQGRTLQGRITHTLLRGQIVYDGQTVTAQPGYAQFLTPEFA